MHKGLNMGNKSLIVLFIYFLTTSIYFSRVPIKTIMKKGQISDVSLSLDGKYMAAIFSDNNDQQRLFTYNIDAKKSHVLKLGFDHDVYDYKWVSNTHLIYYVSYDKQWTRNLTTTDRDLKNQRVISSQYCVSHIVDGLQADPDHAIISQRFTSGFSQIGKINIHNGRIRQKEKVRAMLRWVNTDFTGTPNLISKYEKDSEGWETIIFRETGESDWKELPSREIDYEYRCSTPSNNSLLYVKKVDFFRQIQYI